MQHTQRSTVLPPQMSDFVIPNCECGYECKVTEQKKEGPNQGRKFFCCQNGKKESGGCGYFRWIGDAPKSNGGYSGAKRKANNDSDQQPAPKKQAVDSSESVSASLVALNLIQDKLKNNDSEVALLRKTVEQKLTELNKLISACINNNSMNLNKPFSVPRPKPTAKLEQQSDDEEPHTLVPSLFVQNSNKQQQDPFSDN